MGRRAAQRPPADGQPHVAGVDEEALVQVITQRVLEELARR
jgi:hypothetical protein